MVQTTARQIPQRDFDALKRASQQLVEATGGVAKAASLTSTSHSRLSEAISPWHLNRSLSMVHIADLECVADEPHVTRMLADIAGFDLVPKTASPKKDMHAHLALIIGETSDVTAQLSLALRDGTVTTAEARKLKAEAQDAITRLQDLVTDCDRIEGMAVRVVRS